MTGKLRILGAMTMLLALTACEKSERSYSLLSDGQSFKQSPSVVQNKIDILFVVDNSGSMDQFQTNLRDNFSAFIQNFAGKGYDFHIAVTASDAYLSGSFFRNNPSYSNFKKPATNPNYPIIDRNTPDPIAAFVANTGVVGDAGSGDERAFSSIKAALSNTNNAGFLREGAFLAVVILSDEDDFSDSARREGSWRFSGGVADHSYSNPGLETVASYIQYFDTLTGTTDPNRRRFNVSAVTVADQACLDIHRLRTSATIIGDRYIKLATDTNGIVADLCSSNYSEALTLIQDRILELSNEFFLSRLPIPETIRIWVNGASIPNSATLGWTYNATNNSILFHGAAMQPPQNAQIDVTFDPLAPKN